MAGMTFREPIEAVLRIPQRSLPFTLLLVFTMKLSTPELSLALNENFKGNSREWQEPTHWAVMVAWNRPAEIVGQYV
jgi:hypothetical protein